MRSFRPPPLVAALAAFALLVALVLFNRWLFRVLFGADYLLWYLREGIIISLASGFLASVWGDGNIKARFGLISQHPAAFIGGCLQLLGIFVTSLSPTRRGSKARPTAPVPHDIGLDSPLPAALDEFVYGLLAFVMLLLGLCWLLVVAPLTYFINLVAGVPARQGLRGRLAPAYVQEQGGQVVLLETEEQIKWYESGQAPEKVTEFSFARDPFAVTQATAAVILWLGGVIYARLG